MVTKCQTIKCLKTIGQSCSHKDEDQKMYGEKCGSNLSCGCDRKCSGCMTINGNRICREDTVMCLPQQVLGKRSEMSDTQEESDYPLIPDINRMVN